MRFFTLISILFVLLLSCSEEPNDKGEPIVEKVQPTIPPEDNYDYDTLQGLYMGGFGGSDIRIVLNYISKKNAIGYNIHKGLQRNLTGKVSRIGDTVQIVMAEPGDNEYDGVFTINFIGIDDAPYGSWESNSGKISRKEFKLKKIVKSGRNYGNEDDDITVSNFANYFGYVTDSIGDYSFNHDGLVLLSYYEKNDSFDQEDRSMAQMKQLKGSWSLKRDHVTINWEPNTIFPDNILELDIVNSEYGGYSLKGEGKHELWMMY